MTKRRGTWPQDFAIQDLRHSSPARGFFPLLLSTLLLFPNYLHQITVRKTQSSLAWELCSLVPPPLPPRHIFVAGRLMLHHTRAPRYHVKTHASSHTSSHLSQRRSDLTPPFSSSLSSTKRFSSLPHPPSSSSKTHATFLQRQKGPTPHSSTSAKTLKCWKKFLLTWKIFRFCIKRSMRVLGFVDWLGI